MKRALIIGISGQGEGFLSPTHLEGIIEKMVDYYERNSSEL